MPIARPPFRSRRQRRLRPPRACGSFAHQKVPGAPFEALLNPSLPISNTGLLQDHGLVMDCATLIKFWGTTRIVPLRGLSISAISMKEIEIVAGMTQRIRIFMVRLREP